MPRIAKTKKTPKPRGLAGELAALARLDPDLGRALSEVGPPPPRRREPGFPALLGIILAQQVSTASAAAIWNRLVQRVDPLTPERLLAEPEEGLRAIGFSRAKIVYGRALASALAEGRLSIERVHGLDDGAAVAALSALPGIGRWSAEIYLLFALERRDIWPAGDLALQLAVQRLKGLSARPKIGELDRIAEKWRPWRSAAARLLWHYYRAGGLPPALASAGIVAAGVDSVSLTNR